MANKNRQEVSTAIQGQAAVVGETEYKNNLDTNFAQSVVFRKDVADTDTAAGTTKTIDFLDIDYIEVTQSNNVAYTFNNIQQGEIKYLKITKTGGQTVSFANGTDVSIRQDFINSTTVVIYKITNKDGDLYIESINIDNRGAYETVEIDIGDWNMNATSQILLAHGITDFTKIRTISVIVRSDDASTMYELTMYSGSNVAGSITSINTTIATLTRNAAGFFATSGFFINTGYNRGWVTIEILL